MKNTILSFGLIISLTANALMAQTQTVDENFIFNDEAVTFNVISADEMATTEGQLFGIASGELATTARKALELFRPALNQFFNGSKREGVLNLLDLWRIFQTR